MQELCLPSGAVRRHDHPAGDLGRDLLAMVLIYEQAIGYLATVPLLAKWTSAPGKVRITAAESSADFEKGCMAYLLSSGAFQGTEESARHEAALVNGYTHTKDGSRAIFLRPGTQGTGIEVHESVHSLCHPKFEAQTSFFLSEGITEYFTRIATAGTFARESYDTEHYFVTELVSLKASTAQILANLYFDGDWAGFYQGLYDYAELVSTGILLDRAASCQTYAALRYLKELHNDPEAPLRLDK